MSTASMQTRSGTREDDGARARDAALITRALSGEEHAFRELVEHHTPRVYAVALRLLGNQAEAEDVTQDVFFKVSRKLDTFREEAALSTWLYRVTVNAATDHMKKRRGDRTALVEDLERLPIEDHGDRPDEALQRGDLRARVRDAMDQLPDVFRTIIVLRELEGLAYEEIASVLSISKGTVESRLFRARAKIKAILERTGDDQEPTGRDS